MAANIAGGKVPHFSMKPNPVMVGAVILILVIGFLLSMSFFSKEEGTGVYRQQGVATLMVTMVICLFLIIIATSKMWYKHLWKKNSTHARHKQHTKHHPAYQDNQRRRSSQHHRRR